MEQLDRAIGALERGAFARARFLLNSIPSNRLPPDARAELWDRRSGLEQACGYFADARHFAEEAYRVYSRLKDRANAVNAALRLGNLERQLENFKKARTWYAAADRLARKIGGNRGRDLQTDALVGSALCDRGDTRYREAIRKFKSALARYRRQRDGEGAAYVCWALGTTGRFAGQLDEAERWVREAVSLYRSNRDAEGLAYARCGLGGVLRLRGLAARSGALYRRAYRVFEDTGDQFGMAYAACGQGNAKRMTRQFRDALSYFRSAEKRYRSLGQKGPLGFVLWNISQALIGLRRFESARRKLIEAGKLFQSVRDPRGLTYVDLGWGELHRHHGSSRANHWYRRALSRAKRFELKFEAIHAQRGLGDPRSEQNYRRAGVHWPKFRRYAFLP